MSWPCTKGPASGWVTGGRPLERVYIMTLASTYKEFDLAFDGNMKKFWNGCCRGYPNQWLQYKFDSPTRITGYGLTTGSGECPSAWVFEGNSNGMVLREVRFFTNEKDAKGATDCYAQRTLVADEGVGDTKHMSSLDACQEECSSIGSCNSFAVCEHVGDRAKFNCYKERTLVADEGERCLIA
ncbi:hypothetical protein AK812_SmicGene19221 [Symbiodinium microadriaticum]|uniref:Uncharacterized protein n=1 Tax=Symbiodinium microadriaticum TaxID=2951 RepID=A0A1Q9DT39_SYMMI|nr:hypothetical protein AK812_SmicGene19221 [Symbiodinium microadriaticum]